MRSSATDYPYGTVSVGWHRHRHRPPGWSAPTLPFPQANYTANPPVDLPCRGPGELPRELDPGQLQQRQRDLDGGPRRGEQPPRYLIRRTSPSSRWSGAISGYGSFYQLANSWRPPPIRRSQNTATAHPRSRAFTSPVQRDAARRGRRRGVATELNAYRDRDHRRQPRSATATLSCCTGTLPPGPRSHPWCPRVNATEFVGNRDALPISHRGEGLLPQLHAGGRGRSRCIWKNGVAADYSGQSVVGHERQPLPR